MKKTITRKISMKTVKGDLFVKDKNEREAQIYIENFGNYLNKMLWTCHRYSKRDCK